MFVIYRILPIYFTSGFLPYFFKTTVYRVDQNNSTIYLATGIQSTWDVTDHRKKKNFPTLFCSL